MSTSIVASVLWYGGLLGLALSVLLLLWALALYAIKHAADRFTGTLLAGALVLAVAASWAVTRAASLDQGNLDFASHGGPRSLGRHRRKAQAPDPAGCF